MMKNVFINFYMINCFEFCSGDGEMFCYRCGAPVAENCETDRFGRCFCSEECRKIYYGGHTI